MQAGIHPRRAAQLPAVPNTRGPRCQLHTPTQPRTLDDPGPFKGHARAAGSSADQVASRVIGHQVAQQSSFLIVRCRVLSGDTARTFVRRSTFAAFGLIFDKQTLAKTQEELGVKRTASVYSRAVWQQKVLGFNRSAPCPVGFSSIVSDHSKLHFADNEVLTLTTPGCYFQSTADITFGHGVWVAPNVGFITSNHDPEDPDRHLPAEPIRIGDNCWIGMNSVILPGVTLGPRVTVAAGSTVTKSFPEGHCIVGGTPAKILRDLEPVPTNPIVSLPGS